MGHTKISTDIEQNIRQFQQLFADSADIKMKEMRLGKGKRRRCFLAYIEVAVSNMLLETTALGRLLAALSELPDRDLNQVLNENAMGISDVTPYDTIEDAAQGMLTGDAILFVDGYGHALKIADKGYPGMGVQEPDSEKVIRGSKEGFTDSIKTNTALIRKRVRSTRVRVEEVQEGVRSHTAIDLVYMADLKYTSVLEKIREKITEYEIDGVMDSGTLEQLAEKKWYSPFPQYQTTERPDRAAMEILNGKIVVLCDNSPSALILPSSFNGFMESSEDWFHHFEMASFLRALRYLALLVATLLPGLYLAVIRFHTQILPANLILSFAKAREGVPFSSVVELIFLELSFELIREAGVRVPGALGNAIGIVGGLIIGQAAVSANLVSPIVVMIVALTALGSMVIPEEEFAAAFRLLKYVFLFLGGYLGILGIVLGIYLTVAHLSGLLSFGMPYLLPFIKKEPCRDAGEGILRIPFRKRWQRPLYARWEQKVRLRKNDSDDSGESRREDSGKVQEQEEKDS